MVQRSCLVWLLAAMCYQHKSFSKVIIAFACVFVLNMCVGATDAVHPQGNFSKLHFAHSAKHWTTGLLNARALMRNSEMTCVCRRDAHAVRQGDSRAIFHQDTRASSRGCRSGACLE